MRGGNLKKFFNHIFLTAIFFVLSFFSLTAHAEKLNLYSDSVILIESTTGRVIYEENADKIYPPASMTKMLTCMLGIEYLSPSTEIKISHDAAAVEYSDLHLAEGDIISAHDLFLGTMLVSDNGGAVAIAQAVGGSVENFVEMLNVKLSEIGCTNTHFANPNGLPNPDHLSTARDMSKIAAYCMRSNEFREIVGTEYATIHWIFPAERKADALSTNELFGKCEGINGIKTGYTLSAGGCMTASAKRGDVELIAVVMHSDNMETRFIDAKTLLDYGFSEIEKIHRSDKNNVEKVVYVRGGKKGATYVGAEEDLNFPLLKGEDENLLQISYELPKIISAEIKVGDVLGKAILNYNGEEVASVPLVAKENVEKGFSFGSAFVNLTEPLASVFEGVWEIFLA